MTRPQFSGIAPSRHQIGAMLILVAYRLLALWPFAERSATALGQRPFRCSGTIAFPTRPGATAKKPPWA